MTPNVLATRYASRAMVELWSPHRRIVLERRLWIAVLRAQADHGLELEPGTIDDYERVVDQVDLDSIAERERVTRHDVKARVEEFSALAGREVAHLGMTSRDLTENVEQLQVREGLALVRDRVVAALCRLAALAAEHADTALAGRTHNVAAQVTTLGKRFATVAEELLVAYERLGELLERYPLRGIKGPVGTQQDLLDLFDGDAAAVDAIEDAVMVHLGFRRRLTSVGQVYPRSVDLDVVAAIVQASVRTGQPRSDDPADGWSRAGDRGFRGEGQVGSSAMPHKMNARSCERINALVDGPEAGISRWSERSRR